MRIHADSVRLAVLSVACEILLVRLFGSPCTT